MATKILIVEDDRDLRRALTIRLKAHGYDVVTAEDGVYAVSTARKEHPDLVLLDIGLPAGDGLTVLDRYSKLSDLCDIPVVVLTGRDEDGTRSLLTERDIDRKLRGIPVIASVPQLWGRQRPETPLDLDEHLGLQRELAALIDRVTEDKQSRRAL